MSELMERYRRELATIEVTAESPRRWVRVRRSDTWSVTTTFRTTALSRLSERELAAEIEQALSEGYLAFRRECDGLRQRVFGADVVNPRR
ncbi:MAG: hypothetical protein ACRDT4_00505 [Micromonosporaceae bacterium]